MQALKIGREITWMLLLSSAQCMQALADAMTQRLLWIKLNLTIVLIL